MSGMKIIEGGVMIRGMRFGVLASRFNDFIVNPLVDGATHTLVRHGAAEQDIDVVWVPGAYEALVVLGAVIRGATPHFDVVANECAKGISNVSMQHTLPIGFGVLTVDTIEQAIERAGTKAGNKGAEAALTAIELVNLMRELER